MTDWLVFKGNEYEDEDEFLLTMEELRARKDEYNVNENEWFSTWMFIEASKREGMETFNCKS